MIHLSRDFQSGEKLKAPIGVYSGFLDQVPGSCSKARQSFDATNQLVETLGLILIQ